MSQAWLEGSRGEKNPGTAVWWGGRPRPQPPTCAPSHLKMDLAALQVTVSLQLPARGTSVGRASLVSGLMVPKVTSLTSISTWEPLLLILTWLSLCFSVSRARRLPQPCTVHPGMNLLLSFNHPVLSSVSPTNQKA